MKKTIDAKPVKITDRYFENTDLQITKSKKKIKHPASILKSYTYPTT